MEYTQADKIAHITYLINDALVEISALCEAIRVKVEPNKKYDLREIRTHFMRIREKIENIDRCLVTPEIHHLKYLEEVSFGS